MNKKLLVLAVLAPVILSIACGSVSEPVSEIVVTRIVTVAVPPSPPTAPPMVPPVELPTAAPSISSLPCSDTDRIVGQSVTCRIERAYCDYRPDVGGAPTFCNDAPYPGNAFTLLVWGSDWSDLDGQCIDVTGFVARYKGKPEIVAESRSQVSPCQ